MNYVLVNAVSYSKAGHILKYSTSYMTFVTVGKVILNWKGKAAWKKKNSAKNETGHDALLTPKLFLALQRSLICFES